MYYIGYMWTRQIKENKASTEVVQRNSRKKKNHPKKVHFRRPRCFRIRFTLHDFREFEIIKFFRLPSSTILKLYNLIKEQLEPRSQRTNAVPGITKLIATLQYLASGSFQHVVSQEGGFTQATFSRFLEKTINALLYHCDKFIHWPRTTEEWQKVKQDFYKVAGIPNVLGAIDCTHVAFRPRSDMEEACRNRKYYCSMNMQVVCNANNQIINVFAAYPGSTHDAHILRNSSLYQQFESKKLTGGWLVGDAGYPARPWLLTPISKPRGRPEKAFNKAHASTRNVIERTFGMLKSRFRCLDKSGGHLLYSPRKICKLFVVCCMLHNVCLADNIDISLVPLENPEPDVEPAVEDGESVTAHNVRRLLIAKYFG